MQPFWSHVLIIDIIEIDSQVSESVCIDKVMVMLVR